MGVRVKIKFCPLKVDIKTPLISKINILSDLVRKFPPFFALDINQKDSSWYKFTAIDYKKGILGGDGRILGFWVVVEVKRAIQTADTRYVEIFMGGC